MVHQKYSQSSHDIPLVVTIFLVPLLPLWDILSLSDPTLFLEVTEESLSLMLMQPEHECKISWKNKSHSQQKIFWQSGHWYTVESRPSSNTLTHELQYWDRHSLALTLKKNYNYRKLCSIVIELGFSRAQENYLFLSEISIHLPP